MTFEEALKELKQGKKIRANFWDKTYSWDDNTYIALNSEGTGINCYENGKIYSGEQMRWCITHYAFENVWEIVEERETITFITDIQPGKGEFLYIGEWHRLKGKYKVTLEPCE